MIRQIIDFTNARDANTLLTIIGKFTTEAGIPIKPEHIVLQASAIQNAGIGAFWVYEDALLHPRGMVGAIIHPSMYDGKVEATELFWYVEPEYRGSPSAMKLFFTVEDWARKVGAVRLRFAVLAGMPYASEIYERLNMKPVETYYGKEL